MSESIWIDRAQSAEAKCETYRAQIDRLKEKVRTVCESLGAKERSDGSFLIDYEAFAERLGPEGALEVRAIIDEKYGITGAAGEKPRMKVKAVS